MSAVLDDTGARSLVERVEGLLAAVESLPDAQARETALAAVQSLVELYGAGLERLVAHAADHDDGTLAQAVAQDELVAHLLLVHDLHPVALEARVREALDEVRPYLESHGGNVELLGLEDGVVRLRMQGSCSGCPSSAVTLKLAIEDAIHRLAPDVADIRAEDDAPQPEVGGLLQIELSPALAQRGAATRWTEVGDVDALATGSTALREVAGEPVLFVRGARALYAYRPSCPECAERLDDAQLVDGHLACPHCGSRYDVRVAGRCAEDPQLHLEPVPLLHDAGDVVRVAAARDGAPA